MDVPHYPKVLGTGGLAEWYKERLATNIRTEKGAP